MRLFTLLLLICFVPALSLFAQDDALPPPTAHLEYGELVNESIRRDESRTFTFDGTAGDRVVIQMNSTDFDAYLQLLDSDENFLTYNDDYNNLNAQIGPYELPETGIYTIVTSGYWVSDQGNFALSVLTEDMIVDLSQVDLTVLADEYGVRGGEKIYDLPLLEGDVATLLIGSDSPIGAFIVSPSRQIVGELNFNHPLRFQVPESGTYVINVGWVPNRTTVNEYEVIDGCGRDATGTIQCSTTTETELVEIPVSVDFVIAYHVLRGDGETVVVSPQGQGDASTSSDSRPAASTSDVSELCTEGSQQVEITLTPVELVINDSVESLSLIGTPGDEAVLYYAVGIVEGDNYDTGTNNEYFVPWSAVEGEDGDRFTTLPPITRVVNCGEVVEFRFRALEDDRPFGDLRELGYEQVNFTLEQGEIPTFQTATELHFTGDQYDTPHDYALYYSVTMTPR